MSLDNQLCFAIYAAYRLLTQAYGPILRRFDLTYTQYIVILVLQPKNNPSLKEIGNQLLLDSGTLSPLLKNIEKKGLIRRFSDSEDERIVRVALTTKGRRLRSKLSCVGEEIFHVVAKHLNIKDLQKTRGTLQALAKVLSAN